MKRPASKPVRRNLATFINFQIVKHGLKSERIWAEIGQCAATFNVPIDKAAYRVLHEHARRSHHIIPDALKHRQEVLEYYTRHPGNRVYSNKELLQRTAWWRRAYKK